MRRTLLTAGRLMVDSWQGRCQWWMVTLTYRPGVEWRPGDVTTCTKAFRKWCTRNGYPTRYLWAFETTKAGRPHYHLLLQLPIGVDVPHFDTKGFWKHGFTQTERAKRAVGYLAKYASKAGSLLQAFRGARCYGVCGLQTRERNVLSFWRAPRWLRVATSFCSSDGAFPESEVTGPLRRLREGRWLMTQTGEIFQSPTVAKFIGGVLCFFMREVAP